MLTFSAIATALRKARACACLALCGFAPLLAHDPFEITTTARLRGATLELEVTMARATALAAAAPEVGRDWFEREQFEALRHSFEAGAGRLYAISVDGTPLTVGSVRLALSRENDVEFFLTYPLPAGQLLKLRAQQVEQLPSGYGAMITAYGESGALLGLKLLMGEDTTLEFALPQSDLLSTAPSAAPRFVPFLVLGLEHILTGYDHLLFLGVLLVACRGFRSAIGIITCFTVAHSVTLALAVLGFLSVPGKIVEPVIAASIVFVAVENLVRRGEPRHRWLFTFGFGLVHGLGFAGALRDAGLGAGGGSPVVPLFAFNLGVELGQFAVAAVVLPLLWTMRDRPSFARLTQPVISSVVAAAGSWWLVQRTWLN